MSDYPERLLPKSNYCIVDADVLMSQHGLWLIRRIDSDKVTFLGNTKTLNPDCIKIQSDHLRDLSNNLLGVFCIEDIFYGIEKPVNDLYCTIWDGIEECVIPSVGHYFRDDKRGFYFIPVDMLLKDEVPFKNLMDGKSESFHFKILHTPTKCNYWHISIRVYDPNNNEVSSMNIGKGKRNRIWKSVRDYLVMSIVKTAIDSECARLPETIYCKTKIS